MMDSQDLEELLLKAKSLLPQPCVEKVVAGMGSTGNLKLLDEFIYHSEFELALDELEALGNLNHCKQEFWNTLLIIARAMDLSSHVARYEKCMQSFFE